MGKLTSKNIGERAEAWLTDGRRVDGLTAAFGVAPRDDREGEPSRGARGESKRAYVVSVVSSKEAGPREESARLAEIVSLVESQGDEVVGQEGLRLRAPNARTLIGSGTAHAIAERARAEGAELLVLDADLSPSQSRNLEELTGLTVCDREAIILNVFLRHARTPRAKMQVEIARLTYLRPRIRGLGVGMDQQAGLGRARGPGETASELLGRKIDARLEELGRARRRLDTTARTQRGRRSGCARIALVGYTNAGKTSLMNAMTGTDLSARGVLFETLDATSRCLTRHGGDVVLSDTVGFIRNLPERLHESFESTLGEIAEASLVVVVADASDPELGLKLATTAEVLERVGASTIPRVYAFTKTDLLAFPASSRTFAMYAEGHPWVALNAQDPDAVAKLEAELVRAARDDEAESDALVPYSAPAVLSLIYARCRVLRAEATGGGMSMTYAGPPGVLAKVRRSLEAACA